MKFVFGAAMLLLATLAVADRYRDCPISKEDCPHTLEFNPVCSTFGCTYSNEALMKCAGGELWYRGECKEPQGGYAWKK